MSHALIIEDELLVAFAIEEALRQLGYSSFDVVNSVQDAIETAQKRRPDLIIANHRIADGSGTDAVVAICSNKSVPVVFVTASAAEVRERLPGALIVDKPFTVPSLNAAVGAAVASPFRHSGDGSPPLLRAVE